MDDKILIEDAEFSINKNSAIHIFNLLLSLATPLDSSSSSKLSSSLQSLIPSSSLSDPINSSINISSITLLQSSASKIGDSFSTTASNSLSTSTLTTSSKNPRYLYHFYIDETFLSSLNLSFLWAGPEEYLDTADMKLLQNGFWLRYREIHYGAGSEKNFSQFILQEVRKGDVDAENSVIHYNRTHDINFISQELSNILGLQISPSDMLDFSKLFEEFDILSWGRLWTNRFRANLSDKYDIYVDVVQFAGESNFYIIGGIDCSLFPKNERDGVRNHQVGIVQPSYSKPMQQLVLLSCFDNIWKSYEVKDCRNNLCLNLDDLMHKYHLELFQAPPPNVIPLTDFDIEYY